MASKSSKAKFSVTFSRRDNFSQRVIVILYRRAGGRCCRCAAPTFGPDTNPYKSVNIGQGAHIAAAAPGGPRYDPDMSPEQRSSATNGMWMCANCHDIIDRDVEEYPVKKLVAMKKEAEKRAKKEIGVSKFISKEKVVESNALSACVSAATIVEIRKSKAELLMFNGHKMEGSKGEEILEAVGFINPDVDTYLPEVGRELLAHFTQLVRLCRDASVLMEVVRRLKSIADVFHTHWNKNDVNSLSELIGNITSGFGKRRLVYQSAMALLKDLSSYPDLKKRGLHTVPLEALRGARGLDEPDIGPPKGKIARAQESIDLSEEEHYISKMEQLSTSEDQEEVWHLEAELDQMGYEANIV